MNIISLLSIIIVGNRRAFLPGLDENWLLRIIKEEKKKTEQDDQIQTGYFYLLTLVRSLGLTCNSVGVEHNMINSMVAAGQIETSIKLVHCLKLEK